MSESNVSESTSVSVETPAVEGATKDRKNRPEVAVTMTAFIIAWVSVVKGNAPSVAKVADLLNMATASVSQKATLYRTKHGIALPNMPRGFDVDAGKALLESLLNPVAEGEGEGEAAAEGAEAEKTETPQS